MCWDLAEHDDSLTYGDYGEFRENFRLLDFYA